MNNFEKIKAMDIDEMANFLKKTTCPQYDLLSGDVCCTCCNLEIYCEEEWEKYVPQYVEWLEDFLTFYNWSIANGYKDDLTIDRINNDGNYEPSNCRWITIAEQAKNRRPHSKGYKIKKLKFNRGILE